MRERGGRGKKRLASLCVSPNTTTTTTTTTAQPANPANQVHDALDDRVAAALTALDDALVAVLARGDIKLVRAAWLLQQPADHRIQRRQDLEALEQSGASPSPLLSPAEAVALVRRGNRSAGALTYGWLMPNDPDPKGARVKAVRAALAQLTHIEGFFWEWR